MEWSSGDGRGERGVEGLFRHDANLNPSRFSLCRSLFALFNRREKDWKRRESDGGGGAERMLLVSYGVDPTGRSQEGEVSIYATWL